MKKLISILILFLYFTSYANADTVLYCGNCTTQQAEYKVLSQARNDANQELHYTERYAVFDPVANLVRTFGAIIDYEPELGRNVREITYETTNDTKIVEAVNAYNDVINNFYDTVHQTTESGITPEFDIYSSSTAGTNPTSINSSGWLYDLIRGQAVYDVPYPSYGWMKYNYENELQVIDKLNSIFLIETVSGMLSQAGKQAFAELVLEIPLQYAVRFENGDTVTFFFDCFCSLPFLPLHETALDSSGNSISSGNENEDGAYSGFYSSVVNNGMGLRKVCMVGYTGESGNLNPQTVCWLAYF